MNFLVAARSVKVLNTAKTRVWLFGLTKGLGGASAMIQHGKADDGDSGKTRCCLKEYF